LRPTRFERKSLSRQGKKMTSEVVICHYRAADGSETPSSPVSFKNISFDNIRTFHNLEAYPYAFEADFDVVQWVCGMAAESPTARMLMKEAQGQGWTLQLADLNGEGYSIDDMAGEITLDHFGFTAGALGRSAYFRNALFINFIRALRALWQERQDYGFETTCRPDALLMLERARAADCETIAILAGWELRAAGHTDIWRFILGSDEGDMAMIFTRAMEKDPAGFYDGSVFARTFCQWYGDENRVAECDAGTLEALDIMLQEGEEFGNEALRGEMIEKLTRIPGGNAYLTGMGANIATDPYFVAMHDAINEAHLFQIVYDSKVVLVEGVPFRDSRLARKIFPAGLVTIKE